MASAFDWWQLAVTAAAAALGGGGVSGILTSRNQEVRERRDSYAQVIPVARALEDLAWEDRPGEDQTKLIRDFEKIALQAGVGLDLVNEFVRVHQLAVECGRDGVDLDDPERKKLLRKAWEVRTQLDDSMWRTSALKRQYAAWQRKRAARRRDRERVKLLE
ncbi:MAG TPA: hypothetical protein VIV12_10400 [Streptosporangiaceae bacterium]